MEAEIFHRAQQVQEVNNQLRAELGARKQVEAELARQTSILKSVLNSIADGVVVADMEGKFLIWNPAAERIVGLGPANIPQKEWSEHYGVFLPDRVTPYPTDQLPLAKAIRGESVDGDVQFLRHHRAPQGIWLSVAGRPLVDESGIQRGGVVVFTDITERKRAEEERDRFFTMSLDLLCIAGFDGYFKRLNPAWERTLGFNTEELLAEPYLNFLHPDDRATTVAEAQKITTGAETISFENRYRCKNGSYRWLSWTAQPFLEQGLIYAAARDITERKRAEEALRRAHDELERRVQERTVELHLKNRDLETLLYVTSHDLREPLRSIENFSRLVHDRYAERLDDKGKDFLRRVVRGAQRMDRLMTDLLALSRVQRMELPVEDVAGASLVQAALRQLEGRIKETGAQVRVANDLPRLRVNETWGTQAISNLIANALKFTSNGHAPEVEVAPYRPGDGEISSGIVVRDRGPGVAPEHAERIFQLFQRAVGREVEGTGAGLAIVRQVAERHGGRAWAQPREGGGSEFIITFGSTHTSERNPS
jgi:PAS domain S-box-containing protein